MLTVINYECAFRVLKRTLSFNGIHIKRENRKKSFCNAKAQQYTHRVFSCLSLHFLRFLKGGKKIFECMGPEQTKGVSFAVNKIVL